MEFLIIGAAVFAALVVIIELLKYGYNHLRSPKRAKIRKRLRKFVYAESETGAETDILKRRIFSEIPTVNLLLNAVPGIHRIDQLVVQANARYPIGFYILLSLLLIVVGYLAISLMVRNLLLSLLLPACVGVLPFLHLAALKRKRVEKFRRQLPDGLDLLARALRAGHAFAGGMKLAAEEFVDPLGTEFAETLDEINFGLSVPEALKNLGNRIDCQELNFFIVGVVLQRETGGNLAELVETLANLIREKFKFQGKVQTLSAEGKLSAVILIALPFLVGGWIFISTPDFLNPLLTEPIGNLMLVLATALMVFGIITIHRMVKIEV